MRFARLIFPALAALVAGLSAQTTRLELGKAVSGDLAEGQTRSYSLKLKAKRYLRVVVTQPVPSAIIEFFGPNGKKALEVDTRNFTYKPSRIVWVAESGGEYRISLSGSGHYEIELQELRKATAEDRKHVEADRLFTQGVGESRKHHNDQAMLSFTGALDIYREIQDRESEEGTLNAAGDASDDARHSDVAIGFYEQALKIERDIKNRPDEGRTLNSLGLSYRNLSQSERAIGYFDQGVMIRREVGDREGEASSLANLGRAYADLSQFQKAVGYYEEALAIFREIKHLRGEGATLNSMGIAYDNLSQSEKAIDCWERALPIFRKLKDRSRVGAALNNIGIAYLHLNQYEKMIGYQEQALAIRHEAEDRRGEGASLHNLGIAYAALVQYEKAIGYYQQALAIHREVRDRRAEGVTLDSLGNSYAGLGQYEQAIAYRERALAVQREVKDRLAEGRTSGNLAQTYYSLGQFERAIAHGEQALAIAREIKDRYDEGRALSYLAGALSSLMQQEKARGYYEQALAISREVKDRSAEAGELSGLMETWQASGVPRLAIFYGKQAVNVVQSVRSDIVGLGQDLQQSFLNGNDKPYHTLAEILIAEGRLAEAEQVLALLKEEEFFQYIRRDGNEASTLSRRADMTPEEAEFEKSYREIGDRLMSIGSERGDLLAKKTLTAEQSQHLVQLEQDLATGNHAFESFLKDLTQHFSGKPEMAGRIENLRETQGIMEDLRELPAGTVAIFTLIGDDSFHAILRTPDAQKAYEYPIKAADLNRKILEFRQVIQDPNLDPRPLARELYDILIGGMADDLRQAKAQTLMWSLDGALRYIPLAALYDGKQYLVEQYRVSVMTLASNMRLKDHPDKDWKAAAFGVTKGFEENSALPSVSAELTGIVKILGGEIKLDDQFTQQSMRQTLLKRYPVVHIASHFRFRPGNDTKSFLLLGDGGHLSLAELKTSANLFGGVQLLTLSACNTGVGDGAEVEGFGTLAQRQGAKAVIASLWPVADESTSLLMQELYRLRESKAGTTKLEALRAAQLRLLRGDKRVEPAAEGDRVVITTRPPSSVPSFPRNVNAPYAHPYYWAPFFLMGNWL
jgi:CHAT domain-containing protein/Tfp pilus assembly protein PilF